MAHRQIGLEARGLVLGEALINLDGSADRFQRGSGLADRIEPVRKVDECLRTADIVVRQVHRDGTDGDR